MMYALWFCIYLLVVGVVVAVPLLAYEYIRTHWWRRQA